MNIRLTTPHSNYKDLKCDKCFLNQSLYLVTQFPRYCLFLFISIKLCSWKFKDLLLFIHRKELIFYNNILSRKSDKVNPFSILKSIIPVFYNTSQKKIGAICFLKLARVKIKDISMIHRQDYLRYKIVYK